MPRHAARQGFITPAERGHALRPALREAVYIPTPGGSTEAAGAGGELLLQALGVKDVDEILGISTTKTAGSSTCWRRRGGPVDAFRCGEGPAGLI